MKEKDWSLNIMDNEADDYDDWGAPVWRPCKPRHPRLYKQVDFDSGKLSGFPPWWTEELMTQYISQCKPLWKECNCMECRTKCEYYDPPTVAGT